MGISRQYKVDVNSLKAANGLRTDVIGLGQKITIPTGTSVASNTTAPKKTTDEKLLDLELLVDTINAINNRQDQQLKI